MYFWEKNYSQQRKNKEIFFTFDLKIIFRLNWNHANFWTTKNSSVKCHPVVVAQRNKEWIINNAIILKPIMPKPMASHPAHQHRTAPTIMQPIITASAQMAMVALNKLQIPKCASFALRFCIVNCIDQVTIIRRPILQMKPSTLPFTKRWWFLN